MGTKSETKWFVMFAQLMMNSIRQQILSPDLAVARGLSRGHCTGESSELPRRFFERIQNDINLQSYRCANGKVDISVSGGATLYSLYKFDSVGHLWENQSIRASDERLL